MYESSAPRSYLADAMAFLDSPGKPLIAHPDLHLDLAQVTVAPPLPWDTEKLMEYISQSKEEILWNQKQVDLFIASKSIHIKSAKALGATAIVMGLQAPPEDNSFGFSGFAKLFEQGVRVFQLWYQDENTYGGGFACPTVHITDKCKLALRALADFGAILDLSHAGHTSAREVITYIRDQKIPLKVMISHTGCYNLFPHMRNLPDDVLRGVVDLGGVVGIYTLTFGLHQKDDTTDPFTKHLAHAINICGADNLVIGSDGEYQEEPSLEDMQCQFEKMKGLVDRDGFFNARCPIHPLKSFSTDKISVLAHEIWAATPRSFEEAIPGIAGLNLKRFFEGALP